MSQQLLENPALCQGMYFVHSPACLTQTSGMLYVNDGILFFRFAPDWVLRKDKLKDIVDPLRAIQMVADTLSIVL